MPLSLSQFLDALPANVPADLKALVLDMAAACRDIGQTVNNSAITGKQGALAQENVQGEVQKELDVIANDMMLEPERWHGRVAAVASEEMDTLHPIADGGEYFTRSGRTTALGSAACVRGVLDCGVAHAVARPRQKLLHPGRGSGSAVDPATRYVHHTYAGVALRREMAA